MSTPAPVRASATAKLLFTLALVCLGLAVNSGSWPLAFLAFTLMSLLLLGYAVPRRLLGAIEGERVARQTAQRGDEVRFSLVAHGEGRQRSRFVLLRDVNAAAVPGEREAEMFVEEIGPERPAQVEYVRRMHQRGVYELGPCEAACSYPFGLFEVRRPVADTHAEMVVLPRVWPVSRMLLTGLSPYRRDTRRDKRGVDDEFVGVREYVHGDERRHVHWRSSARLGRLVIREFQTFASGTVTVLLDFNASRHCSVAGRSTFEDMIDIAASMGAAAAALGRDITFAGWRRGWWSCKVGRGAVAVEDFLQRLAKLEADGSLHVAQVLERMGRELGPNSRLLAVLSDQNGEQAAQALAACANARVAVGCVVLESRTYDPGLPPAPDWPSLPGVRARIIRGDLELAPQLAAE